MHDVRSKGALRRTCPLHVLILSVCSALRTSVRVNKTPENMRA